MLTSLPTGVYSIRNKVNGKRYVGSAAVSIRERLVNHRSMLRRGRHYSIHLQRAWSKYGERQFEFTVLERCLPNDCVLREQVWLDFFRSYDPRRGYNTCRAAGSVLGLRHSPETLARLSTASRGNTIRRGSKHRPESIEKMRVSASGKVRTPETRAKISQAIMSSRKAALTEDQIISIRTRYAAGGVTVGDFVKELQVDGGTIRRALGIPVRKGVPTYRSQVIPVTLVGPTTCACGAEMAPDLGGE